MQAPRSLARAAQPRVQRIHSQGARADATSKASAQGAGREQLEVRLAARSVFERPGECGACVNAPPGSRIHWVLSSFAVSVMVCLSASEQIRKENHAWQQGRWNTPR